MSPRRRISSCLLLAALGLSACGGQSMNLKVWPFGGSSGGSGSERARDPASGGEYQCAAGKGFSLRRLEDGAAFWLILPEREVRLERIGSDSSRYGKGGLALELSGDAARLIDGGSVSHADCNPAAPAPK